MASYTLACTYVHTHMYVHAYTHMYIHTSAPRSIAAEIVGVEVSAEPLSVNFTITLVS